MAAVADGHGGSRYVRSDVGARLAVQVACAAVGDVLVPAMAEAGPAVDRLAAEILVPTLVTRWKSAVATDLAARRFTEAEGRRAGADLSSDPLLAYGTTLLVAVWWEGGLLALQLGDGDIVAVDEDGRSRGLVPVDPRLVGGATTSLCMPQAAEDFRITRVESRAEPALLLLATDGYANAFADSGWRGAVGRDLLRLVRDEGVDVVAQALPFWLDESASASGDDVTVALLLRDPQESRESQLSWLDSPPGLASTC